MTGAHYWVAGISFMLFGIAMLTWHQDLIGMVCVAVSSILVWNAEDTYEKRQ